MDPLGRSRLAPTLDNSHTRSKAYLEDKKVQQYEQTANDLTFRGDLTSGYAGQIPRKFNFYGKSHIPETKSAIAELVDFHNASSSEKYHPQYVLPDRNLLPKEYKVPTERLFQVNPNIKIPSYMRPPLPTIIDGIELTKMGDLNPNKKHIVGYTGYIPQKKYNFGTTFDVQTNKAFIQLSSDLREHKLINERPCTADWYAATAIRPGEKPRLKGYHAETPSEVPPTAGYTGFIPGFRDDFAITYSDHGRKYFKGRDLKYSTAIDYEAERKFL